MVNMMVGGWVGVGGLVNNRNKPAPRTVLWIRIPEFRLTLTEKAFVSVSAARL